MASSKATATAMIGSLAFRVDLPPGAPTAAPEVAPASPGTAGLTEAGWVPGPSGTVSLPLCGGGSERGVPAPEEKLAAVGSQRSQSLRPAGISDPQRAQTAMGGATSGWAGSSGWWRGQRVTESCRRSHGGCARGTANLGHADQGVARNQICQVNLAHALGPGWPHRKHQVADVGRAIQHSNLDPLV